MKCFGRLRDMEHFFGERPRSSPNDGETPEPIVTPSFEEAMEAIEREVEQAQPVSGVPVGKRMEGEVNINTSPLMFHRRLSPPQVKPSAQRAHPEETRPTGGSPNRSLVRSQTRLSLLLSASAIHRRDPALQQTRHLRFIRHMLVPLAVVPSLLAIFYASLLFLPAGRGSPGSLMRVMPEEAVETNTTAVWTYCPRTSICSQGTTQLALLAVARLSGYIMYVALALSMLSKCYNLVYCLRATAVALYVPIHYMHNLHHIQGLVFLVAALVHTLAHLTRWILRARAPYGNGSSELVEALLFERSGLSGIVAIVLMLCALMPMYARRFAQRCKLSFELRHSLHFLVVPMLVVLCWHHTNVAVACVILGTVWGCDRAYLFFARTVRIDDVTFTRLADGCVQVCWKNPPGRTCRPGEYVRLMVPAISRELHPFSTFDYLPERGAPALTLSHDPSGDGIGGSPLQKRRANQFRAPMSFAEAVQRVSQAELTSSPVGRRASHSDAKLSASPSSSTSKSGADTVDSHSHELAARVSDIEAGIKVATTETYSQVLIGPFGNWTRSLSEHVQKWSENGESYVGPCWVQGPFTSPFNASFGYGRLIVVVTGIGLAAALPIVHQLSATGRDVFLVWTTRSHEQIAFHLPMLLSCTAAFIFFDGPNTGDSIELPAEVPHVRVYRGRPTLDKLMDWIVISRYPSLGRTLAKPPMTRNERKSNERGTAPNVSLPDARMHLPDDPAVLYSSDATPLLRTLPAEDRSAWAVLYCGNVPPVKRIARAMSRRWGFLYSEESFAW